MDRLNYSQFKGYVVQISLLECGNERSFFAMYSYRRGQKRKENEQGKKKKKVKKKKGRDKQTAMIHGVDCQLASHGLYVRGVLPACTVG
jgi:hypothetical protein